MRRRTRRPPGPAPIQASAITSHQHEATVTRDDYLPTPAHLPSGLPHKELARSGSAPPRVRTSSLKYWQVLMQQALESSGFSSLQALNREVHLVVVVVAQGGAGEGAGRGG